jgi:hypothetical protein
MIPVPLFPNMPVATNTAGKVVFPKQYYKCPDCNNISPLRGGWFGLEQSDRQDLYDQAKENNRMNFYDICSLVEARLKEKNT